MAFGIKKIIKNFVTISDPWLSLVLTIRDVDSLLDSMELELVHRVKCYLGTGEPGSIWTRHLEHDGVIGWLLRGRFRCIQVPIQAGIKRIIKPLFSIA